MTSSTHIGKLLRRPGTREDPAARSRTPTPASGPSDMLFRPDITVWKVSKTAAVEDQRAHRGLEAERFDPQQHQLVIARRDLFDDGAIERHRRSRKQHRAAFCRKPFQTIESIARLGGKLRAGAVVPSPER